MIDSLGDRIKNYYEDRCRYFLPRRSYFIIRVDGKAFHTYCKGLKRPFDNDLISDIDSTAAFLCKNIQGAKFAYTQSDEISILVSDFDSLDTDLWFDGNIQKMVSVSASLATSEFNLLRSKRIFDLSKIKSANFDARVFQIPSSMEVENYFIWRQQDCSRNSISSVAQSLYSPKELISKNSDQKQELIFQKGINWNDFAPREKRGGFIERIKFINGVIVKDVPEESISKDDVIRNKWTSVDCPIFTQNREFLSNKIPKHV